MEPDRRRLLSDLAAWLEEALGAPPVDLSLYESALTHGSFGAQNYQRLEFLGDRVLGLAMARWLFAAFPQAPEGEMARRFNTLVTGIACAQVGREVGVGTHLRLGKQARDSGGSNSDNILGDVVEALIGALYLEHGFDAAEAFIRRRWRGRVEGAAGAGQHPKSALQEWASANNRRAPSYKLIDRSGPDHAPQFTVRVDIGPAGEATATGPTKQEAETRAAIALLARLQ